MARERKLAHLRSILQRRRRQLLEAAAAGSREVAALHNQPRDPELEESAQTEMADSTLSHLVETERLEVAHIDAALARMDAGVFGVCIDCGDPISRDRLEAVPFTLRCEEDAERREAGQRVASPASTHSL